jgi:hypothetical protein
MAAKRKAAPPVAERLRIVAEPKALRFAAAPGAETIATMQVANHGKKPVLLARHATVRLRRQGALREGVIKAFKETPGDLIARLVVLGDALKHEAAAEASVTIEGEFDALAAGERRQVRLSVRWPQHLDPAIVWTGSLALLGTTIPITIDASKLA